MEFRLTHSQLNFYTQNSVLDNSIWNQSLVQVFPKVYGYEQLNDAYNKLRRDHEGLRVRFRETSEGYVSYVEDYEHMDFPFIRIDSEEGIVEEARKFVNKPIDFHGILVNPIIFNTPNKSGIIISAHHIAIDGYCSYILAEDINKYLQNPEYCAVTQPYSEHIEKENKHKLSRRFISDKDFWKKQFSLNPACNVFSSQKAVFDFSSEIFSANIPADLITKVKAFCFDNEISPASFFNTVYAEYIHRMYDINNFTIGVPVLNRVTQAEINTIGLYMHTLPLVIDIQPASFFENVKKTDDLWLDIFRHQKTTQYDIKQALREEGKTVNTLYDIVTDFLEFTPNDDYEIIVPYGNHLSIPLEFHLQSFSKGEFSFRICYQKAHFTENEIKIMFNSIIAMMEDAVENPHKIISDLEMLSSDEKHKVLYEFNSTAHSYDIPNTSTLYSLFENTAKENKDKTCIKIAEKNVSFSELLNISEKLDTRIREITKGEKSVIAVIAERSAEMYASVYGIIRGGNAYLPIDPDYPQERIDYILENSKAKAVTAQGKFCHLAGNVPCVDMTAFIENADISEIHDCAATPDDTAYVIYTSGSTGTPKGAKVSHKSAVNRILWMHDKYPLGKDDVILQKTPYTFDVSVWELFWWGLCGGSLACSKPGEHFLPAKILDEVHSKKVTHLHFVPSVFELFLNYLEAHSDECNKFKTVRYVFLSGEALSAALVQRFYKLFDYNKVTLHNLYGPTECAVDVTYYDCSPAGTDPVPIGKPVYNTQMYIVDKHMNPVPVGVMGEICIAGDNVGQGYLNNPDLTAEKFIDNPFGEGKLYRTGDNGYWREDSNIVFVGRTDGLIKLNGQRIETGEIEAVISSVNGVYSAAVIVKKVNDRDVLVAFYTGKINCEKSIKEHCLNRLPKYMVPSAIKHLDCLPLNQNGKLDRKKLTEIHISFGQPNKNDEPTNETEAKICKIFESVLEADKIGRSSNFFDIGGSSISMISVLSEEGFENITAAEFIRNPTPAKLAQIMLSRSIEAFEYLEPLHISENSEKAMILLPFAGGGTEVYSTFVNTLKNKDSRISVYFIRYLHSIEDCEKAADEIRTALEGREILLYSHCVGSAVALYILNKLEKEQFTVKHYFAGASLPPERPVRNNIWNIVPDMVLKRILTNAGADFSKLLRKNLSGFLKKFRKDTDFANISFYEFNNRLKTPISIIISKTDIFTKQYAKTESLWLKYFYTVSDVHYIASDSHYFQKDNSEELIRLILRNK